MKRGLALVLWAIGFSGCGTKFRAPVCGADEQQFPAGAEGHYRYAAPVASPQYTGSYTDLSEIEFYIKNDSSRFAVTVPPKTVRRLARLSLPGHAARHAVSRRAAGVSAGPGAAVTPVPYLPLTVCKIGDAYYSQDQQDDGTYTLSRFDLSASGITTTPLAFKPDEVAQAGLKSYFIPTFSDYDDKQGTWSFDPLEPSRFIIDNSAIDAATREKLVALGHPIYAGLVFSREP